MHQTNSGSDEPGAPAYDRASIALTAAALAIYILAIHLAWQLSQQKSIFGTDLSAFSAIVARFYPLIVIFVVDSVVLLYFLTNTDRLRGNSLIAGLPIAAKINLGVAVATIMVVWNSLGDSVF